MADKPKAPEAADLETRRGSLKKTDTIVKNPLPTKEDIAAEKAAES